MSTLSKSTVCTCGTPRAASCRATWRPIAPTPTTVARISARRSAGTSSRCRTNRSVGADDTDLEIMATLRRHERMVVSSKLIPKIEKLVVNIGWRFSQTLGIQRTESCNLNRFLHVGQKFLVPGDEIRNRKRPAVVHGDGDLQGAAGADVETQPC